MKECTEELIDMILKEVVKAPESQIDNETRTKLKECNGTYAEKYDAIVEVSKMDLTKISSFVRELCALDKHYVRPNCA
jgi:hypothetical protein